MYFFLSHLSFCDLCYSMAVGPKMLVDIFEKNKSIPFYGCAVQLGIFCTFADSECMLLAVMAFDRYKAISNPLLYTVNMSSTVCSLLTAGVYMVGMADAVIHTTLTFRLCFCGSNEINHFFCDAPPLLLLSCSDTQVNELMIFIIFGFIEGTMLFMYFRPSSAYSLDQDKMTSLFYTLVIPMLNPLIYSLRNKDVKEALEKLKTKRWF
ncbi:Olfactory Receptor 5W2 [Manis pentadactyla]|nr:Olfactory Receptor 5W2 [Manis pentadactyla]